MDMTNQEYNDYVAKKAKPSPVVKNVIWAFVVGGLICVLGQWMSNVYQNVGLTTEQAGGASSMTLIVIASVLTGLGLFDKLAKHAGAGTLVPITGFANAVVSPALEFKHEGYVTGTGAKLFAVAGPVIVFGVSASVLYGFVLVLVSA